MADNDPSSGAANTHSSGAANTHSSGAANTHSSGAANTHSSGAANIPLPTHGFEALDELAESNELGKVPAVEVISRAAVMLMSASAEKLGLASEGEPDIDLDEARRLITSLAGLVAASQGFLGIHRQPLRDGVRTLQAAFREASSYPDEPGEGPGEQLLH